jgi:magnesium transporter
MNFDHMPELHLPYAYPAVLMLMASITVGMLLFFKHKRWL